MMDGLPEGWASATLALAADIALGKMLDREKRTRGTPLPYLRNANVRWGSFDLATLEQMPFEDHEMGRYAVEPGDLMVCEGGEPGRAAVWSSGRRGLKYQKALLRVRPRAGIDPRWVMYRLKLDATSGALEAYFTGSTIKHFPQQAVARYELPFAPLAEQRRIVAKVEALLAEGDAARERLAKVPAILKRFRQAVLAAACSGRLTEEWRESRSLDEWSCLALGESGLSVRIGPFGSLLHREEYEEGGVPLVNPMHIRNGRITPTPDCAVSRRKAVELSAYRLELGDVVLGRRGEMGRAAVVREEATGFLCGTGSMFIRAGGTNYLPDFVCLVLRSPQGVAVLEENSVGSTMTNLNKRALGAVHLPQVSLKEQAEVVQSVDALFKVADSIERHLVAATARADKITQAVLAKAFRGELVPTEAELAREVGRDYEPASELLRRTSEAVKHQEQRQAHRLRRMRHSIGKKPADVRRER